MFLVGLTGGIASGKSTVADILKELGAPVIDADSIARQVVEPGKPAWKKIKEHFGAEVLLEDGTINRPKLGEIIFADAEKRRLLNSITHPYIHRAMFWEVVGCFFKGYQFAVLDLPLLFESGVLIDYIHKIIVAYCDEEQQLERLMKRNKFPKEEAERRIKAQMPLEMKCQKAHFVIDNTRSVEDTKKQTENVYKLLLTSRAQWKLRLLILGWIGAVVLFIWWIYSQIPNKRTS